VAVSETPDRLHVPLIDRAGRVLPMVAPETSALADASIAPPRRRYRPRCGRRTRRCGRVSSDLRRGLALRAQGLGGGHGRPRLRSRVDEPVACEGQADPGPERSPAQGSSASTPWATARRRPTRAARCCHRRRWRRTGRPPISRRRSSAGCQADRYVPSASVRAERLFHWEPARGGKLSRL
jgi:hypothetical protein